jgi:CheY-like chemotaxis protein
MTQTILLADDDEMTRRVLRLYCMRCGYDVIEAGDGQEALKIVERNCPNLVIMDILMPVLDGFSTVRQIRLKLNGEQLPVLFLTARANIEAENECLEAGAQRFLTKPVNLGDLFVTIREFVTG